MAFYIKKNKTKTSTPDLKNSGNVSPEMRPFYKILGCVIVLIIVLIIWAIRG